MLLARYAPVGSQRFEKLAQSVKSFDKVIEWLPTQLFGIWSIFVAGMAAGKAQTDRFYFWDWNDWLIGVIGIIVIALLYSPLTKKLKIKNLSEIDFTKSTATSIFYTLFGFLIFIVGWLIRFPSYNRDMVLLTTLYLIFFLMIILVHSVKYKNNLIYDSGHKNIQTIVGIIILLSCIMFGFSIDDPIISTASIVSLPFLLVLLFGKHVRHLERAKFYPIFIFVMFVVSREAWFLIPVLLLFFILRSYNYLRYQKVYPTFGVTDDQS